MTSFRYLSQNWCNLSWSPWIRFTSGSQQFSNIPKQPGVYRVKPIDSELLMYIGQTGRTLHQRLNELRTNSLKNQMPFNDPHTAAPSLWAWRDATGMDFECSAAPFAPNKIDDPLRERREREGFECYLLWQYRLEHGSSTLCNFGRFHPNYIKSTDISKNKRGGRCPEGKINPAGGPSLPPLPMHGKPSDEDWMNLNWTKLRRLSSYSASNVDSSPGLYKILNPFTHQVIYIGQSNNLKIRLQSHARKNWGEDDIRFSWCTQPHTILPHQLKEFENDLIGGYYSLSGSIPVYQFMGH